MIKNLKRTQKKLSALDDELKKELSKQLAVGANKIRNTAIDNMKSSPPDAGRTYKRRSVSHSASFPSNPPRVDTGNLVNSITVKGSGIKYNVGSRSQAPYGKWLEFGTSTMAARPWLRPALEANQDDINRAIRKALKEGIKKVVR